MSLSPSQDGAHPPRNSTKACGTDHIWYWLRGWSPPLGGAPQTPHSQASLLFCPWVFPNTALGPTPGETSVDIDANMEGWAPTGFWWFWRAAPVDGFVSLCPPHATMHTSQGRFLSLLFSDIPSEPRTAQSRCSRSGMNGYRDGPTDARWFSLNLDIF